MEHNIGLQLRLRYA